MTYAQRLQELQADPATSYWLKEAAAALGRRDPVDAYCDAQALAEFARARVAEMHSEGPY